MLHRFELGQRPVRWACGACPREFRDREGSKKERKAHRMHMHMGPYRDLLAKTFCGFCGDESFTAFAHFDHMEMVHGYEWMRMQTAHKQQTGTDLVELYRLATHAFVTTNTRISIEEVLASIAEEWPAVTAPPPDPSPAEANGSSLFAAEDLDSLTKHYFNNRTPAEMIASGQRVEEKLEEKHDEKPEIVPVATPAVAIKEEHEPAMAPLPTTPSSISSMTTPSRTAVTPSPSAIDIHQETAASALLENLYLQIPDIGSDSDSSDYHQKIVENFATIVPLITGDSSMIFAVEKENSVPIQMNPAAGRPNVIVETVTRKRPSEENATTETKKQRGPNDGQPKMESPQPQETKTFSSSTFSNESWAEIDLKDLLKDFDDPYEEKWAMMNPQESKQEATGTAIITSSGSLFPTPSPGSSAADGNAGVGVEHNGTSKMKEPISPAFSSSSMSSASGCSTGENIDPAKTRNYYVPAAKPQLNVNGAVNAPPHMQQLQELLNNLPVAAVRPPCAEEREVAACMERRKRAQSANSDFFKARVDQCPHCDFVISVRSEIARRKHVASFHYDTYNFKSKTDKKGCRSIDLEHYCMNNLGAPDEGPLSLVDDRDPQLQNKTYDREREMKNRACLHCPTVATSRVSLLLHLEEAHLDKLLHFLVQYRYLSAQCINKDLYLEHFAEKYKGVQPPGPAGSIVQLQAPI